MPTTALVERRNWLRLPVSLPATFTTTGNKPRTLHGEILNLSEAGAGFTLTENIQHHEGITVSFQLSPEAGNRSAALLEPIAARLTLVSSRYAASHKIYAYGGVFVGLKAHTRREIRCHLQRSAAGDRHVR